MFGRIRRGWIIAKQSWNIVRKEPAMWPFPLISALATILLFASFIAPALAIPDLHTWFIEAFQGPKGNPKLQQAQVVIGIASLAFYFINYFIIVFFNTALAACAVTRFKGGSPTVAGGLQVAVSRLPQVLAWALLAATVGVVLRTISERSNWLGKIVVALIGVAWTIAAYLVVPTLAVEGLGPIAALKRSSHLISESWGEGLAGNFGMSVFTVLLGLPGVLVFFGSFLFLPVSPLAMGMLCGFAALYLIALAVLTSAMKQVFIVGLYFYAAEKQVPAGFSADSLEGAFRKK
jgi:hypothetical protein